jgi:NADH:ubiquinone reductase (non-electrogenic)
MNSNGKPKLVVLGTGFAALSLIRHLRTDAYDVVVVSPRNHFLFTPLLPSTTVGTVEFRSIIEPIRQALDPKAVTFYQARCTAIDPATKLITCEGVHDRETFLLGYDSLVIAVGAVSKTFGVPGVEQFAFRLKELSDARAIRQRIIQCFERASTPMQTEEERRRLLHFVIVWGGPTGVEFAAELHDLPATAQVALQEGKYLARELNRVATGRPMKGFRYRHLGMLASIGDHRALADLPNVKLKGLRVCARIGSRLTASLRTMTLVTHRL